MSEEQGVWQAAYDGVDTLVVDENVAASSGRSRRDEQGILRAVQTSDGSLKVVFV